MYLSELGFLDYEWWDDAPACTSCDQWSAQVVIDDQGRKVRREWHRQDCPVYLQWRTTPPQAPPRDPVPDFVPAEWSDLADGPPYA